MRSATSPERMPQHHHRAVEHGVAATDFDPSVPRSTTARSAAARWAAPVGVAAAAAVSCALVSSTTSDSGPVLCPFRLITGLDCPGCGMTRGVAALTRGDVGRAADHNLLLFLLVPLLAWVYLAWASDRIGLRLRVPPVVVPTWLARTVLGAVLAYWVVRNLAGFEWLRSDAA